MTDNEVYDTAPLFESQCFGPLYIVSGRHARGRTFYAYLLDPGQTLKPSPYGGNNRHPDLRDDQEIFGIVRGQPGWTEEYGWKMEHPSVQDGSAQALLVLLIEAQKQAQALGMINLRERQTWIAQWASSHLTLSNPTLELPALQSLA